MGKSQSVGVAPPADGVVESLGNGVTREWALGGKLMILTLDSFSRATVDTWAEASIKAAQNWTGDTMYMLNDHSVPGILVVPPYVQSRVRDLARVRTDLPTYVGVVIPKTLLTQLVMRFISTQKRDKTTVRLFFKKVEALDWFKSLVAS